MRIDETTLAILSRVTIEGNTIFLTCGQLDRKQYVAVNKVLENIGGKWNRKGKCHIFDSDPTDKLENVLLTGETTPPAANGVFFTPPELGEYVVGKTKIEAGDQVLEPSAGQGGLAIPLLALTSQNNIHCIELLPENVTILEVNGFEVQHEDFLSMTPFDVYEHVVMNPPFRVEGRPQADIDHVLHAWEFVRPGGRLTAIMSAGVEFRENKKTVAFRRLVDLNGTMERLPEDSFKESGTRVNTVLVMMIKGE